jgi:hypothetical protein
MGSPHIRRAAVAAVAALLVVGLAACDDDPEVERDPDASASGTPIPPEASSPTEPTPTGPVEPTLPAEAKEPTKAGAVAFVEYYWDVVSYALVTGDLRTLASLGGPGCSGCQGGVDFIKSIYSDGGSVQAGPYRLLRITRASFTNDRFTAYEGIAVTRSSTQVIEVPGEPNQTLGPVTERARMTLLYIDDSWRADILEVL